MTDDTKQIPLLIVLEYMKRVNNLLNKLIREDKFPAILFAKYDNTFNDLLKMAQVMNFKYRDIVENNEELGKEAQAFVNNLDKWEEEYHKAVRTQPRSELGITEIDEGAFLNKVADEIPAEIKHMEKKVKEMLGKDLFDECLGRIESKSRAQALNKIMEEMVQKGDIDDEVAN